MILSLEPYMKCGRGVCGCCEVAGYHACTDGPTFRYSDLMGAEDFLRYRRGKSGRMLGL
jgi:dihydroorotate dehydrogenase electron transfer subunit